MKRPGKPPRSPYTRRSTADEVTADFDLTGKVVLITGCNSGLGFETTRVLASRGAQIIGAARNRKKAEDAANRIDGEVMPVACELSDLGSVVACADEIDAMERPIDILICKMRWSGLSIF